MEKEVAERRETEDSEQLADQLHPGYLIPLLKSALESGLVFPGPQTVTLQWDVPFGRFRSTRRWEGRRALLICGSGKLFPYRN
jgi:hypothetical protein